MTICLPLNGAYCNSVAACSLVQGTATVHSFLCMTSAPFGQALCISTSTGPLVSGAHACCVAFLEKMQQAAMCSTGATDIALSFQVRQGTLIVISLASMHHW